MHQSLETRLRELCDRQDIIDALHRYCRGMDRLDRELALSAYHADAIDDHGIVVLKAAEFVDWALGMIAETAISTTHHITNATIEVTGDSAHCESYFTTFRDSKVKPDLIGCGRYVDRFEKRNGKWAIAARVNVAEVFYKADAFVFPQGVVQLVKSSTGAHERSRKDISYQRPLKVERAIQGQTLAPLPK